MGFERYERRRAERLRRRAARRRRRALWLAAIAAVAAVAVALLAGGGGGAAGAPHGLTRALAPASRTAPLATSDLAPHGKTASTAAWLRRRVGTSADLPQTHALPTSSSRLFRSLMNALWEGVREGRLSPARIAFFPQDAYVRLKSIYGAAVDWRSRLLHDYELDIRAAHRVLGAQAGRAQLVRIAVRSSYAHWIEPGVCSNAIGYYEMPNARVVYRESGRLRSFGIASMISWRGEWYVVHLGAILRSADVGEVDEPASGPGTQAYSGTC